MDVSDSGLGLPVLHAPAEASYVSGASYSDVSHTFRGGGHTPRPRSPPDSTPRAKPAPRPASTARPVDASASTFRLPPPPQPADTSGSSATSARSASISHSASRAASSLGQGRGVSSGPSLFRALAHQEASTLSQSHSKSNISVQWQDPVASTPFVRGPSARRLRPVLPPPLEEQDENRSAESTPRAEQSKTLKSKASALPRTALGASRASNSSFSLAPDETDLTWSRMRAGIAFPPPAEADGEEEAQRSTAQSNSVRVDALQRECSVTDRSSSRASSAKTSGTEVRSHSSRSDRSRSSAGKDKSAAADESHSVTRLSLRAADPPETDVQAELQRLRDLVSDQQAELIALDQEKNALLPQLDAVLAEKLALVRSLDKLASDKEEAEEQAKRAVGDALEAQEKHRDLNDKLQEALAALSRLESDRSTETSRSSGAINAHAKYLEEELRKAHREVQDGLAALAQAKQEVSRAEARAEDALADKISVQGQLEEERAQVSTLEARLDQVQRERKLAESRAERAGLDKDRLGSLLAVAEKEKKEALALVEQLEDRAADFDQSRRQELADRSAVLEDAIGRSVAMDSTLTVDLVEHMHDLQAEVDIWKAEVDRKMEKLDLTKAEHVRTQRELAQLRRELDEYRMLPSLLRGVRCSCRARPLGKAEGWETLLSSLPKGLRERPEWSHNDAWHDLSSSLASVSRSMRPDDIASARAQAQALSSSLEQAQQELSERARDQRASQAAEAEARQALAESAADLAEVQAQLVAARQEAAAGHKHERDALEAARRAEALAQEKRAILREREALFADHEEASKRLSEVSSQLRASQAAVVDYRQELTEASLKIDALTASLQLKGGELQRATSDRAVLQRSLEKLRMDLRLAQDRAEGYKAEMERRGSEAPSGENVRLRRALAAAESALSARETDLGQKSVSHKRHIQSLFVQIRYLKARFVRESDLRADLAHQKTYLARLAAGLEATDDYTSRFLADIARSRRTRAARHPPNSPLDKFRHAALAVRALCRMRLMHARWANTSQVREAMREARKAATAHKVSS